MPLFNQLQTYLYLALVLFAIGLYGVLARRNLIALLISGKGLLGVVASLGLLKRARWARALVLFIAFLSLFELPFGTALAIYTLWVLLSPNADQEYRTLAAGG